MSGMDKILEIHGMALACIGRHIDQLSLLEDDSDLVCQAGARWMDVNEVLKEKGPFWLR